ncbi:MAG: hypothetical protein ABH832_04000 [bacterium]
MHASYSLLSVFSCCVFVFGVIAYGCAIKQSKRSICLFSAISTTMFVAGLLLFPFRHLWAISAGVLTYTVATIFALQFLLKEVKIEHAQEHDLLLKSGAQTMTKPAVVAVYNGGAYRSTTITMLGAVATSTGKLSFLKPVRLLINQPFYGGKIITAIYFCLSFTLIYTVADDIGLWPYLVEEFGLYLQRLFPFFAVFIGSGVSMHLRKIPEYLKYDKEEKEKLVKIRKMHIEASLGFFIGVCISHLVRFFYP